MLVKMLYVPSTLSVYTMSLRFKISSATEVWNIENSLPSIPTFSLSLDEVLGDKGLHLGTLTELLGLPGSGKTQLCLQLCASIQIPKPLGGLSAEALYIDTNTNFTACRFRDVLCGTWSRCQQLLDISLGWNIEENLKRLHYVDAFGLIKFTAFMERLPTFIQSQPNIRLIVIDSITFPFKEDISPQQRSGLLFRLMADLHRLVLEKRIAVVLTNELSTRLGLSGASVVGALGDAWAHRCNTRVLLTRDRGRHRAALLKASHTLSGVAEFQITDEGIRDTN